MKTNLILLIGSLLFSGIHCQQPTQDQTVEISDSFDVQGHRGAKGLMPENSIPGFIHAIDIGVTTLEMDAVITADGIVILSHEPYFSPSICVDSTGLPITESPGFDNNIYHMTYEDVRKFDCGSKFVESHPQQQKLTVYKPALAEVIDTVEKYIQQHDLQPVDYNIEIKSSPKGDSIYHPHPDVYAEQLLAVIQQKGITDKAIIQSFDLRALKAVHNINQNIRTALLIGASTDYKNNLDDLGFIPTIYSPNWRLVNKEMVAYMQDNDILVVPWTVNEQEDMQHLIDIGVDGIITDYPDRLIELVKG